jgi:uncharacterized coiled-coil protein SlyX
MVPAPADDAPHDPRLADRLTNLETMFTHLERLVADLNAVLLEHGRRLDELAAQLERMRSVAESGPDEELDSQG